MFSHITDPVENSHPLLGKESEPKHTEAQTPGRPQDAGETHLSDVRQTIITAIRVTGLTLGLRMIPAGFYVTVQVNGAQWQTSNKPVHVDLDIVEWNEQIVLSSEPSCKVRFRVYASFELGPILGHGNLLRTFETRVAELLDLSETSRPIVFQPKAGEVISPCTSLFVAVEHLLSCDTDISVLHPITLSTPNDTSALTLKTDAGHSVLGRYHRMQNIKDLNQSIAHFDHARDLCPVDHPCRPAALFNLATVQFISCQVNGTSLDLHIPISLFQDALDLRSTGHPDRPATQLHLAVALLSRFEKRGLEMDADAAAELLNEVLDVCHAKSYNYRETDDPHALDEVISLHYEALKYYSTVNAQREQVLCNLGAALQIRFWRRGIDHDLDEAIQFLTEARSCLQVGDPDHLNSLHNLATTLFTRFQRRRVRNDKDLDDAITLHKEALDLQPVGHLDRPDSLNGLVNALSTRFLHRSNYQDLDEGIMLGREALDLRPVGHPNRSLSLSNLATALSTSFQHRGNDKDLDEAISFHKEALELRPVGHPDRHASLSNLATALSARFERRGNVQDLDEVILLHRKALDLRPVGHPDRHASLSNLATALSARFERRGNVQDLDEVIPLHREALDLRPVGHPDRYISLDSLATALSTYFEYQGNDEVIDEVITLSREALNLQPVGYPDRSGSLNNLATALGTCFEHRHHDNDLDEGILLHREALDLHPIGHPKRSISLHNLAIALSTRFQHRGDDKDLDEAIELHMEALALHPVGHADRSKSLISIVSVLSTRFEHRGNGQDFDEAITLGREALTSHPVGHLYRCASLSNLACALLSRSKYRRNDLDLDEAILLYREALESRPVGHPDRHRTLHNIAAVLSARFKHRRNVNDLNEALADTLSAFSHLTTHDPHQFYIRRSLASVYMLCYELRPLSTGKDVDSLNAAMGHYKACADFLSGGLLSRLKVSLLWVHYADRYTHNTLLDAYTTSIQLLDAYMSATAAVSSRHHIMKSFPATLAVDAASCVLQRGEVCRAVELLEQGRTLIWTQMARFRMPLDDLQERGNHAEAVVNKFRELSSLLDKPPAQLPEGTPRVKVEAEATRYTRLVDDWSKAVEDIRGLEGFSRFMLPPLFSDIQDSARDGPIILLIASKSSCNAIIIPDQHPPVRVQLITNLEKLERSVSALQRTVKQGVGPQEKQTKLVEVLRELWVDVVCPVVDNLRRFSQPGSRIWWCPTSFFNFLPLHAAGEYRQSGMNLSKLYISSYTPSITALTKARRRHVRFQSVPFAAIGQDHPEGFPFTLESVEPELELVRSLLPPVTTFTKLTSADSTKSEALLTLRSHHWLHFACHGTQNFDEPFKSAFLMRDQPLTLLDITQTDLFQHEFAFLSACETAVGDAQTPDEVIHLAAGPQFAGVKSVIGTFWSVDDATVRRLVEAFYKNFCGDGKMNSKRASRALHRAVQSLANDKNIPLDQRIVFMHIGL
ncbi:hypothetical protein K503DRAFT_801049 [Rhizopogon vinicolor AM-OR11-026]|uniref:CHAT domain-containing protein n=1 Tax=Rhizopogon vinicolor AM-OR11-026 TaxID=1314800 RepID=A0A1B7MYL2_9AGAM|nr:hypothetical protein K503DRAFT_801049 [Rhizopogon vinicolor AM-OR11-026]